MKPLKTLFFLFFVLLMGNVALMAQSNQLIDELLEEEGATFGKTAYLVLTAAGLLPEEASPGDAVEVLGQQEWGLESKGEGDPITLGEMAFLFMRAFEMKGGIMYRLFPGPRYAARELAFRGFIQGSPSAYRIPSGEEAVMTLSGVLDWKEGQ